MQKVKFYIRALAIFIFYMLPCIVLLYTGIQLILFFMTYGLPMVTKLPIGYNTEFLNSLPVIFHPAENKIGQILLTTLSGMIGWKLIEEGMSHGKREVKEQIVLDLIAISYLTILFCFPIQMQNIVSLLTISVIGITMVVSVLDNIVKQSCFPLWRWIHRKDDNLDIGYDLHDYTENTYTDFTECHEGAFSTMGH